AGYPLFAHSNLLGLDYSSVGCCRSRLGCDRTVLPFIAIGLAVAAAVVGLIYVFKHWGEISTWLTEKWSQFKSWMGGLFSAMVTSISGSLTSVWTKVTGIWSQITGFLSGINLFDIGKNIIDGLINGISSMATAVFEKVKSISSLITEGIKDFLGI
ncbi:tail tape measure protein TP901 core region protein, partial [Brevibacillus agri BAB-2500]